MDTNGDSGSNGFRKGSNLRNFLSGEVPKEHWPFYRFRGKVSLNGTSCDHYAPLSLEDGFLTLKPYEGIQDLKGREPLKCKVAEHYGTISLQGWL